MARSQGNQGVSAKTGHLLVASRLSKVSLLGLWVLCCCVVFWGGMGEAWGEEKAAPSEKENRLVLSQEMPLLRWMIGVLPQGYVDPSQLDPPKMFRAAMESVGYYVPGLWVKFSDQEPMRYTLQVGKEKQAFEVGGFLGILDVWLKAQAPMRFLKKHYKGRVKWEQIDFYAVKGMLSTLDKQTRLVDISQKQLQSKSLVQPGMIGVMSSMEEGKLIIKKVVSESPADYAGLQKGDQIVRIQGEPVHAEMKMEELAQRLRGLRGTRLELFIQRAGWASPRRFVLIRAQVAVPLVSGFLLPGRIGYIRLTRFDQGASLAIREEMGSLRRQMEGKNFAGIILDLRGNPGGHVTEAVSICSMFVERGDVVTFAGANIPRKTYKTLGRNTEEMYPLAVLLDGRSASASELLAGALQMHNRAVVLGRQSYGKGTVQRAGPVLGGRFFMAITIAQYLLPQDVSVQGVGIIPDIELLPVRVQKDDLRYYRLMLNDIEERKQRWPLFLQQNLGDKRDRARLMFLERRPPLEKGKVMAGSTKKTEGVEKRLQKKENGGGEKKVKQERRGGKKRASMSRALKKKARKKGSMFSWSMPSEPEDLRYDFDVWFAQHLLLHSQSGRRDVFLEEAKPIFAAIQRQEDQAIASALAGIGIDWRRPQRNRVKKSAEKARLEVKLSFPEKTPLKVGGEVRLRVHLHNQGASPLHRVHAIFFAKVGVIAHRELLFGFLGAGQKVEKDLKVRLPAYYRSGNRMLRVEIEVEGEKGREKVEEVRVLLPLSAPERPLFRVATQLLDRAPDGNRDGVLQPGEKAALRVVIEHHGSLPTSEELRVAFLARGVRVNQKWITLGVLNPKERKTVEFSLKVPDASKPNLLHQGVLRILDAKYGVSVSHAIPLPLAPSLQEIPVHAKGVFTFKTASLLWNQRNGEGMPIAIAKEGSSLPLLAKKGECVLLALPEGLFGKWVSAQTAQIAQKTKPSPPHVFPQGFGWHCPTSVKPKDHFLHELSNASLSLLFQIDPPSFSFPNLPPALLAAQPKYLLEMEIRTRYGLRDLSVFTNAKRKVFYLPLRDERPDPLKPIRLRIPLTLKAGNNAFAFVVRTERGTFRAIRKIFHHDPKQKQLSSQAAVLLPAKRNP